MKQIKMPKIRINGIANIIGDQKLISNYSDTL